MEGLERLVDDDFSDIVPIGLRGEGVDTGLINELARSPHDETFRQLYLLMDPETEDAFYRTLDWYANLEKEERVRRIRAERAEIYAQLEESRRRAKELFPNGMAAAVNLAYTSYLQEQGLPEGKINLWRYFLLWSDITVARIFKHGIDDVNPDGFGPYAVIGYLPRKAMRYFMTEGATKG